MHTFEDQLRGRAASGAHAIWVEAAGDEARFERVVGRLAADRGLAFAAWDGLNGWTGSPVTVDCLTITDALTAVTLAKPGYYVLRDAHLHLNAHGPGIPYRRQLAELCKAHAINERNLEHPRVVLFFADGPPHRDIREHVSLCRFPLPTPDELRPLLIDPTLDQFAQDHGRPPAPAELRDAAAAQLSGLTMAEADMALSLATSVDPDFGTKFFDVLSAEKAGIVRNVEGLTYVRREGLPKIHEFAGFDNYVDYLTRCRKGLTRHARDVGRIEPPRGAVIVGAPGCLHADTPIYDPTDGSTATAAERHAAGTGFHVWALGRNATPTVAEAEKPYLYPPAEMVELEFDTGQKITTTFGHKIWNGEDYVPVSDVVAELRQCGVYRLPTTSEPALADLPPGVRRSTKTPEDSPAGYRPSRRSCGVRLRSEGGNGREPLRRRAGALRRTRVDSSAGGRPVSGTRSPSRLFGHRPTSDCPAPTGTRKTRGSALRHREARQTRGSLSTRVGWPPLASSTRTRTAKRLPAYGIRTTIAAGSGRRLISEGPSKHRFEKARNGRPTPVGLLRSCVARVKGEGRRSTLAGPCSWRSEQYNKTGCVVSAKPAGTHEYYDFHVPGHENYWACGTWHHNTGKSKAALAAPAVLNTDLVTFNVGAMLAGRVGESESLMRRALETITAMSRVTVVIDEIEKALGRAHETQRNDGGIMSRLLGELLTWLADDGREAFVLVTANRLDGLPDELIRAGRFDCVFYTDLPDGIERAEILRIHLLKRGVAVRLAELEELSRRTDGFSGAELEQVVRSAMLTAYIRAVDEGRLEYEAAVPTDQDMLAAVGGVSPAARRNKDLAEIAKKCQEEGGVSVRSGKIVKPQPIAHPKLRRPPGGPSLN